MNWKSNILSTHPWIKHLLKLIFELPRPLYAYLSRNQVSCVLSIFFLYHHLFLSLLISILCFFFDLPRSLLECLASWRMTTKDSKRPQNHFCYATEYLNTAGTILVTCKLLLPQNKVCKQHRNNSYYFRTFRTHITYRKHCNHANI